ncbi:MAG: GPW/gp25 family protein [Thermoanaerobaculia bacterium]
MQVHFPFLLDGQGRVAQADHDLHIRNMIEQILFTAPGERVNRPDFGCGLLRLLFGPGEREEVVAMQFLVQQNLHSFLADLIEVTEVQIRHRVNGLRVTVEYIDRTHQEPMAVAYEVAAP